MTWPSIRISKPAAFAGCMVLSAAAVFMPPGWTDWLKGITQLLVPAQAVLYGMGAGAARSMLGVDELLSGQPGAATQAAERSGLEHQLAVQAAMIAELQERNAALRALRERFVAERVRVLEARVVARDVVAARDSLLLGRGSWRGVRWQDWVATRLFIDAGGHDGVERQFAVLAREALIGRVESVRPNMSRVALLSDVESRLAVRVGRLDGDRFVMVDYPATLRGAGRGRMTIDDVPERYVALDGGPATSSGKAGRIARGDLVLTAPGEPGLRAPMAVGRVGAIHADPRKRLVYTVEVEPAIALDEIVNVFVIAAEVARDDLMGS